MFKRIPTCIGVCKKKHKVLLLDIVLSQWSFFSPALVAHWLYIWLLLHGCVFVKVPKTNLHPCEMRHPCKMRQQSTPPIQITKHRENLDSATFYVRERGSSHHHRPHIPTPENMRKQSTGKYYVHLLFKRCKIHFTELKLESNITFFLGCVMSNAVVHVKSYDHRLKNSAPVEQ